MRPPSDDMPFETAAGSRFTRAERVALIALCILAGLLLAGLILEFFV